MLLLATALPSAAGAVQVPAGYYLGPSASLPDTLHEVWHGARFRIVISRVAHDSLERHLLDQAERLMPPRDSIENAAAAFATRGGGWPRTFAAAAAIPGERWWWLRFDDILIPYALTGSAAVHLVERVRALSGQPNPSASFNPGVPHTAAVEYRARVERRPDEAAPYQVQLEVRFSYYCGPLCALSFVHTRTVDFNPSGRAVRVRGDQPPRHIVS